MDDTLDKQLVEAIRAWSASRTEWSVGDFGERFGGAYSAEIIAAVNEIDRLELVQQEQSARVTGLNSFIFVVGFAIFATGLNTVGGGLIVSLEALATSVPIWVLFSGLLVLVYRRHRAWSAYSRAAARSFALGEQWFHPRDAFYNPRTKTVSRILDGGFSVRANSTASTK